jgi:parvulin-like peptidyl-prolyl isomerase
MRFYHYFLWTLAAVLLLLSCGEKKQENIVARVGKEKILFNDFVYNFTVFPQHRQNATLKDARLQHLNHMINRLMMYLAAEKQSLERDREIQDHLKYIEHKEVLRYLYKQEVLNKSPVSGEEAWEEYKRSNLEVKIRHLFADTPEEAEEYYRRLQKGESFERIARETFRDSTLAKNGGDLGFITLTDLDPFLADSVYNLKIGQFSHPLRSSFGYHIMKVENVRQSIFLSKEYFENNKEQYINALQRRRGRVKSAQYLSDVLKGKSVTIKTAVLKELIYITETLEKPRRQEYPLPLPAVTDAELQQLSANTGNIQQKILVEFSGGRWTVEEFLRKLKQMPPMHRPTINTEKALAQHIIDMVRDGYLIQEAYSKGLHKKKTVVKTIEKWRKELLANEFRKRIMWVDYQQEDSEKWRVRKKMLEDLTTEVEVVIDSTALFHDVTETQLNEKVPLLPAVIRDYYIW